MKTLILLLSILIFLNAEGRYRAYKLEIKNLLNSEIYTVTTALPPKTYLNYYETNRAYREITIVSTWICWGNTSNFTPICQDPREEGATAPKPSATPAGK